MPRRRSVVLALATLALALAAPTALAGGGAGTEMDFTIDPGTCSQIADQNLGISGHVSVYESVDGNGRFHTTVRGTATDTSGGSYVVRYTNQSDALFNPGYTGPYPVVITMTDHFALVGNGAADKIHAHFTWRIEVTGPWTWNDVFFHGFGDSFFGCDPI